MCLRRRLRVLGKEDGSILPLAIGFVVLVAALIAVTVDLTGLYLAQKRVEAIADAAALAGASSFDLEITGTATAAAHLENTQVEAAAARVVQASDPSATLVSATTPDTTSAVVEVHTVFHPPLASIFVPNGIILGAEAISRTALH